jgi:glycosyltransferase involved in cell wall biosynthesis
MNKVSVIIPSYNKAEYTRRTVESVLAQTYPFIEIIVVDDGSRDETAAAMARYKDRIRFIQKINGGACSARNEGIRHATGKYVALLDCDDLYSSEKIKRCVDYLEKNPQFGFVYTDAHFIDENDVIVGGYHHPQSKEGWIARELILGNFICNSTIVVKKVLLDKVGFFDQNIFTPADWDMWLRLAKHSQAGYLREPLTQYRVVDNYIFNRLELARKEEMYVLEKFFGDFSKEELLKKAAYSNFYMRFAQCAFLKNDLAQFWSDCRSAIKNNIWNTKIYAMGIAALIAPGWLKTELSRRILRREV